MESRCCRESYPGVQHSAILPSLLLSSAKGAYGMSEPVITLDSRFSDPGAVATAWEETLHMLETAELFWLSTVRTDGRPHVTPVVAVWVDGAMHFMTGTKE